MLHRKRTVHIHRESPQAPSTCAALFKGLTLALLSGVCFSSVSVMVKDMKNVHPGQLAMYRFVAILAFSLPAAVKGRQNLLGPKGFRLLLSIRGFFGATNLFLNFVAFRYLPLGEASVIIFSVPVFVTVFARVFLKEECGYVQSATVLLTVIGIVLTARIPQILSSNHVAYTTESLYGLLAALGSLLFNTCSLIVVRKVKSVHYAIVMFNASWVSLIETTVLTYFTGDFTFHPCGRQPWMVVGLGVLSYLGQMLLTLALQLEQAGAVSTVRAAADIVLAFLWQTFLFRQEPDAYSAAGAALVGFSVVFIGLRKWVLSDAGKETACYRYLSWLQF